MWPPWTAPMHDMEMTPDNWNKAKTLFEAALELDAFPDGHRFWRRTASTLALRQQVEKLLVNYRGGWELSRRSVAESPHSRTPPDFGGSSRRRIAWFQRKV